MPFYAGFWLGLGKLAGSPSVRGALKRLLSNPQTTNELALVANSGDDALLHMVQASAKNTLLPVATGRLSPEAAAKMLTDEIRTLSLAARNIASPESGLVSMFLQEAGPQLTPQAKALEAVLETEGLPAERNSPWLGDGGGSLTDDFAKAMEGNLDLSQPDNYTEGEQSEIIYGEIRGTEKQVFSAEDAFTSWQERGYTESPYIPGGKVVAFRLDQDTRFVRVYDGENSHMEGSWFMLEKDIAGLTAEQIQEKFALPNLPRFIVDLELPAGTLIQMSEANGIFGHQGRGVQFDSMNQYFENWSNPRPLY